MTSKVLWMESSIQPYDKDPTSVITLKKKRKLRNYYFLLDFSFGHYGSIGRLFFCLQKAHRCIIELPILSGLKVSHLCKNTLACPFISASIASDELGRRECEFFSDSQNWKARQLVVWIADSAISDVDLLYLFVKLWTDGYKSCATFFGWYESMDNAETPEDGDS